MVDGSCYCGKIVFELAFPTGRVTHCHCVDCRRSHGAAFVTWTSVPLGQFRWVKGTEHLKRCAPYGFCAECGTSFYFHSIEEPDTVYVTVASLTSALGREPEAHVSYEERAIWLEGVEYLPKFRAKTTERM